MPNPKNEILAFISEFPDKEQLKAKAKLKNMFRKSEPFQNEKKFKDLYMQKPPPVPEGLRKVYGDSVYEYLNGEWKRVGLSYEGGTTTVEEAKVDLCKDKTLGRY